MIFNVERSIKRSNNRKYDFYQIQLRNCVIPHLHGISTDKTCYDIMFVIQGHF